MKQPGAGRKHGGLAIVEMTIILPVFLLLVFGVVELYRALLANNILVNMSREGANLIVRSSWVTPDDIMNALADTAAPLDMPTHGAIFVSVVVGEEDKDPYVLEQYRWTRSGYSSSSRVWSDCSSWQGGSCDISGRPRITDFTLVLEDGETTHVVEVFYDYNLITDYILGNNIELYSHTLL